MVINDIRRRGHKTKAQIIKQTERESLSKSPMLKTSTKKLGMLARQIAGKTVDDALEQMRFSKKGAAQSVRRHLEYARDEAMVRRGMAAGSKKDENGMRQERPVEIELKDGRRRHIDDRTKMYIDQAWVGRGPYEMELELRARGKTNVLRKPWTSELRWTLSVDCILTCIRYICSAQGRGYSRALVAGKEGKGGQPETLATAA